MKKWLIAVFSVPLLTGCGSSGWSDEAQAQYMQGCARNPQMKAFCKCSLGIAMDTFTEDEARKMRSLPKDRQVAFAQAMLTSCRKHLAR